MCCVIINILKVVIIFFMGTLSEMFPNNCMSVTYSTKPDPMAQTVTSALGSAAAPPHLGGSMKAVLTSLARLPL